MSIPSETKRIINTYPSQQPEALPQDSLAKIPPSVFLNVLKRITSERGGVLKPSLVLEVTNPSHLDLEKLKSLFEKKN